MTEPERKNKLALLDPRFYLVVCKFLAALLEAGIMVQIIETGRSDARQDWLILNKKSWRKRSLHQDGFAIDICPFGLYDLFGPDKLAWGKVTDPIWVKIATIGKSFGLEWGGDWKGVPPDGPHFQASKEMLKEWGFQG